MPFPILFLDIHRNCPFGENCPFVENFLHEGERRICVTLLHFRNSMHNQRNQHVYHHLIVESSRTVKTKSKADGTLRLLPFKATCLDVIARTLFSLDIIPYVVSRIMVL